MMETVSDKTSRSPGADGKPAAARRTPGLLLGPYYPLAPSGGAGADLWERGAPLPDGARCLQLEGRLIDLQGLPVAGALVEIWHADHQGCYRHPSAPGNETVVTGFAGHGSVHSNAQGCFAFRSLVPGGYVDGDVKRAPHIHVQVTGRVDRLVTQIFLPAHPLNGRDRWYRAVARPELLTPDVVRDEANILVLGWTVVLTQG